MSIIGRSMKWYRSSPLHPHLSKPLASALGVVGRFASQKSVIRDTGQFRISLERDQFVDAHIIYEGSWEPETTALLQREVKKGAICLDVGAHIGWTALTMAAASGESGRVLAFEPSGWAYNRLLANINLNRGRIAEIVPMRVAIGREKIDDLEVQVPDGFRLDGTDTATTYTVDLIPIDSVALDLPRVDLIKTDTDGFELDVMDGAAETVGRHRPVVVFEVAPRHLERQGRTVDELLAWFQDRDFLLADEYRPEGQLDDVRVRELLAQHVDFNAIARPA